MSSIEKFFQRRELKAWKGRSPDVMWKLFLTGEAPQLRQGRRLLKHIPSNPRCKLCYAPFSGAGAPLMRVIGKGPSSVNPRICDTCISNSPIGGAEIELTLLFADVRGSTTLAEKMSPLEYSRLINHFFSTATRLLIDVDAFIDRLVGDQVIALFLPAFSGLEHATVAIETAKALLHATGHARPGEPWIPVGVGIHTGQAFVGKVGSEGVSDFTVLGDAPNVAARLSSLAQAGDILISESAMAAAHIPAGALESQTLQLKGRSETMTVGVLHLTPMAT
jgi:adenylate cyclase